MQFCNIFMTFWWNEIIAMLGKLHELKYKRPKGLNRARFAEVKASAHRSALEIKVIAYILGTRTSIFFPNHESVMNHPNGFRNVFVKRSLLYLSPPSPFVALSLSLSLFIWLSLSQYFIFCAFKSGTNRWENTDICMRCTAKQTQIYGTGYTSMN